MITEHSIYFAEYIEINSMNETLCFNK